ncbi:olfactory receptor 13H1-like [Hyla sarda]|uniref:olfactory receptor 13H1-like n=1 Tax=Hyla sarda TaxID=327740 RepID=UPI0024C39BDE|nr:olfactory receptor 13H1-like [Hyla sarda]
MDTGNETFLTEFILTGFPQNLKTRIVMFVLFLLLYTLTILGNCFIIFTVVVSPQLHNPMYFFLLNLSFLDICYSSNSLPKILLDMFSKKRRISVIGCLAQMNLGLFLGETECILLAVMAYDRYIAICFPLYYTIIMNKKVCRNVTILMWSISFITSTLPIALRPLTFCRRNRLDHFACEILALLGLACGDLSFYKTTIFFMSLFTLLAPFIFITGSYFCIILAILKIRSTDRRTKTFSTCASHLTVVLMFYGASMTMYLGQTKTFSYQLKYISLMYGVITPALNPLIYSLRNNDVKEAFQKIMDNHYVTRST